MNLMKNFRDIIQEQYDVLEEEGVRAGKIPENPSATVYDDASWHYKLGILKKVPKEMGATHIGFFLRWCGEKGLLSETLLEKIAENKTHFADDPENWSYRTFVIQGMNGVFSKPDLTEEGQAFANVYYTGKKNPFNQDDGTFLENYEELVNVLYRLGGPEYYRVKDIDVNYGKVRDMLDERYAQFLQGQPEQEQEQDAE
jgi:hypothetical protein